MMEANVRENRSGTYVTTINDARAFVPDPLPQMMIFSPEEVIAIHRATSSLGRLAGLGRSPGVSSLHRVLAGPLLRREATTSSRMEGTRTDLDQLMLFEASEEQQDVAGDAREVSNYLDALLYGLQRPRERPISASFIRELHTLLLSGVRGDELAPGEFRRTQNWIGHSHRIEDARFIPPPPTHVVDLIDDLVAFIERPPENIPPPVRIALVHFQFDAIHPFLDGNGRVGRLLVILLLIEWGEMDVPLLSISEALEERRRDYIDGLLAVSRDADWEGWIRFFLDAFADQAERDYNRIVALQDLREAWRAGYLEGRSITLLHLVDFIVGRPVFSISQLVDQLGVAKPTAQRSVDRMIGDGHLREVTGQRRNRIYIADEVMQIVMP